MNKPRSHPSLLVVDDGQAMRQVLRTGLEATGYAIEEASTGEAAVRAIERRPFDLVILDINMPGAGGIEACRRIRQIAPHTGIVMISVHDREDDVVQALEGGADDYVTKPFRLRELLARIRAVNRRSQPDSDCPGAVLRGGDLELDVTGRIFRKAGREIRLSQKEFDILAFLMGRPDTPVPHARLLQAVWGPEYGGETEYLRTYVKMLRKKIEKDAARPEYILTEPWMGYRFHVTETPSDAALAAQ